MRTIYDKALRSLSFLEVFRSSYEYLINNIDRPGHRTAVPVKVIQTVMESASVYSVANLRVLYESSQSEIDDTYPQRFACRLPSPVTWIEAPSFNPSIDFHPFYVANEFPSNGPDCTTIVRVMNFAMFRDEFCALGCSVLRLDEHGCSTHPMTLASAEIGSRELLENSGIGLSRVRLMTAMSMYFLAFLNCRNIEIVEHKPSRQARRSAERAKEPPPITYRTLEITPVGKTEIGRPKQLRGDGVARHLCRGHFKRYTTDRPLLGKHVGQYWWAQHARGDSERGVVFKDYAVDVAPNA